MKYLAGISALLFCLLLALGCDDGGDGGTNCESDLDCLRTHTCQNNTCVETDGIEGDAGGIGNPNMEPETTEQTVCYTFEPSEERCLPQAALIRVNRTVRDGTIKVLVQGESEEQYSTGNGCCANVPETMPLQFDFTVRVPEGASLPYSGTNGSGSGSPPGQNGCDGRVCDFEPSPHVESETADIRITHLTPTHMAGTATYMLEQDNLDCGRVSCRLLGNFTMRVRFNLSF